MTGSPSCGLAYCLVEEPRCLEPRSTTSIGDSAENEIGVQSDNRAKIADFRLVHLINWVPARQHACVIPSCDVCFTTPQILEDHVRSAHPEVTIRYVAFVDIEDTEAEDIKVTAGIEIESPEGISIELNEETVTECTETGCIDPELVEGATGRNSDNDSDVCTIVQCGGNITSWTEALNHTNDQYSGSRPTVIHQNSHQSYFSSGTLTHLSRSEVSKASKNGTTCIKSNLSPGPLANNQ